MDRIVNCRVWTRLLPVLVLLLAGCGPMYETQYHFQPPGDATGRQLVAQCRINQNMCKQNCGMREDSCRHEAERRGRDEYRAYVRQREREKQPIKRSPESFISYYRCDSDRCEASCDNEYRGCYVESGGRVTARQVCTAFCDQPAPRPAAIAPAPGAVAGTAAGIAASQPVVTSDNDSGLCRQGRKIEVLSEGEWYPARVKGPPSGGSCPIHYDGYGADEDEDVDASRMRPRQ